MNILGTLSQKFTSGSNIPVERVSISRDEYEGILDLVAEQEKTIESLRDQLIGEGYNLIGNPYPELHDGGCDD